MATYAALLEGRWPGIPACLDLCDCIMIEAVGCSEMQQQRARRKTAAWGLYCCQSMEVPQSESTPVINRQIRQSRASSRDGFCLKIESITTRRKERHREAARRRRNASYGQRPSLPSRNSTLNPKTRPQVGPTTCLLDLSAPTSPFDASVARPRRPKTPRSGKNPCIEVQITA